MAELKEKEQPIRREHDSMDDFEHLEHVQDGQSSAASHFEAHCSSERVDENPKPNFNMEEDMINFSMNQLSSSGEPTEDPRKTTTMLFLESEKETPVDDMKREVRSQEPPPQEESDLLSGTIDDRSEVMKVEPIDAEKKDGRIGASKTAAAAAAAATESEFESEVESSPAKSFKPPATKKEVTTREERVEEVEIAPKEIFRSIGIDAWFNPDRLNPKVAALIYWRDPKKSGPVFGCILGVLLSLAYFSLISVLAYASLLVLTGTIAFRIHNTIFQAIQKTSDGHPFQNILELDLTLPTEKVHEVADVAVAHLNAAVCELRRLFLVEDFVDSLKFGVLLWCLTYVGSWFNGMTLIIIGVVALFTLPKVYETNKAQIDQNLALVQSKINELTNKVKAAIPFGKKEPKKEE
ncbi:reticulon-1-B-like isoform X4 [Ceratina calcarata]|uniref:Reticulon-like protein n=1 Tax=Ceratina calcarata TaxID=156304 RepID=A0AAJ7IZY4_9HYME|nr:reticulon-1-B-like isoform X4 [Ceratina calcarata]